MFSKKPFLVSIDDVKEQQYVLLRQAVWNHMEAQQTISTFTVLRNLSSAKAGRTSAAAM